MENCVQPALKAGVSAGWQGGCQPDGSHRTALFAAAGGKTDWASVPGLGSAQAMCVAWDSGVGWVRAGVLAEATTSLLEGGQAREAEGSWGACGVSHSPGHRILRKGKTIIPKKLGPPHTLQELFSRQPGRDDQAFPKGCTGREGLLLRRMPKHPFENSLISRMQCRTAL